MGRCTPVTANSPGWPRFGTCRRTRGQVVYADPEGGAASHREPVAIFTGEVLPQYAGNLDDRTVRELLDELAGEMGWALEQEEIHIAYGDRTWTLTAGLQPDR